MIATIPHTPRITEEPEIDLSDAWFKDAVLSIEKSLRLMATFAPEIIATMALQKRSVATEAQALALLIEEGPNIRRIAERLGVHRSTLYRWTKFMATYDQVRTGGRGFRMAGAGKGGAE